MAFLPAAAKGGIYQYKHPSISGMNSGRKNRDTRPFNYSYSLEAVKLWRSYGRGEISIGTLLETLSKMTFLYCVNIDANNQCNLSCRQCLLGFKDLNRKEMEYDEWVPVLDECIRMGAQFFAISGREPFYDEKAIRILEYLKKRKDNDHVELSTGLVTNGTLIGPYFDTIGELALDYLVFSVDGVKKDHDAFRGQGVFDCVADSINRAVDLDIADRVIVSSIYHRENFESLDQMLLFFYKMGVRHFTFSSLIPNQGTPPDLMIDAELFKLFIDRFSKLAIPNDNDPLEIIIDLEPQSMLNFHEFCSEGIVDLENLEADIVGTLYQKIRTDENIDLYLRLFPNSCTLGNICRISADGYYLMDYKPLCEKEYWRGAQGDVREEDIKDIFHRNFQGNGPLKRLAKNADRLKCRDFPCFPFCLGVNKYCIHSKTYTLPVVEFRKNPAIEIDSIQSNFSF